jgi:hypothetical protein
MRLKSSQPISHCIPLNIRHCLLGLVFLTISPSVLAQAIQASVADPNSLVPPVAYRSVFQDTAKGVEQDKIDWRKANNDVGRFERGHVDILKAEQMDEKKASEKRAAERSTSPSSKPSVPSAPSVPAAPSRNSTHKH